MQTYLWLCSAFSFDKCCCGSAKQAYPLQGTVKKLLSVGNVSMQTAWTRAVIPWSTRVFRAEDCGGWPSTPVLSPEQVIVPSLPQWVGLPVNTSGLAVLDTGVPPSGIWRAARASDQHHSTAETVSDGTFLHVLNGSNSWHVNCVTPC